MGGNMTQFESVIDKSRLEKAQFETDLEKVLMKKRLQTVEGTRIMLDNLIDHLINLRLDPLLKKHSICGYLKNELTNFCDLVGYIPSNTESYPEHDEIEKLKGLIEALKNY